MSVIALIGAQWGDEGKGHIADALAAQSTIVARYNGGDNAGHSITIGDTAVRTHLVPAGAFHLQATCILGAGMVINLHSLAHEVDELNGLGANLTPARLKIDRAAQLLLPGHIALDGADEAQLGADAIGTTRRGIGPAYTEKMSRLGVRAGLMAEPDVFADAVRGHVERTNARLTRDYAQPPIDADAVVAEYVALAARFAPHLADTTALVHAAIERGERVLAEGAQGTHLDVDHGTYPFVTSSSPTAGGACTGLGIGPNTISEVMGIVKAYTTRVGSGAFPTEQENALGEQLRERGQEYGATRGRNRGRRKGRNKSSIFSTSGPTAREACILPISRARSRNDTARQYVKWRPHRVKKKNQSNNPVLLLISEFPITQRTKQI